MKYWKTLLICSFTVAPSGCGTVDTVKNVFSEEDLTREVSVEKSNKRLSVLQYQAEIEPDVAGSMDEIMIPTSWDNKFWPQSGGYPSHSMGNLGLGVHLKKAWESSVGEDGGNRELLITQPIVVEGTVYTLDTEARLSAFDTKKGKRKWKKSFVPKGEEKYGVMGGGVAFARNKLFLTTGYAQVLALNPETAEVLWKQDLPSPARAAPSVMSGQVYVMTLDNKIQAFSAEDGAPLWTFSGVAETTNLLGSSSPAVDRNVVIATFSSGEIVALRAENGRVIWSDNLASMRRVGSLSAIADIRGLPVIDKGIVYAISYSGRMVAIDERTGTRLWQKQIGGAETPWAAGDNVFVLTSNQELLALDRRSGDVNWVSKLPRFKDPETRKDPVVWTGPVLAGNRLIAISNKGHVIEISPLTGELLHKWKTDDGVTVPPVVADNTLYLLTNKGDLIAYREKK